MTSSSPSNSDSSESNGSQAAVVFLQWALPRMGYRWEGFRKPRGQVLKRIRERMAELKLSGGYDEYKNYLEEHPKEWENLDALCDVTISKFFRDRMLWDFLRDTVLRKYLCGSFGGKVAAAEEYLIWSAGCCNGEEPYSLAIIYEQLKETEECARRTLSILATDRNGAVLQRAVEGRYPGGALKEVGQAEINSYFHKEVTESGNSGSGQDRYFRVLDRLRENITFEKRDIRKSIPDPTFDMVLCRNLVFTYFTIERQEHFLERLKTHLKKDSFLVIGSNEEIPETDWLERYSKTHPVYQKVVS